MEECKQGKRSAEDENIGVKGKISCPKVFVEELLNN
jgi:hypothetical protein